MKTILLHGAAAALCTVMLSSGAWAGFAHPNLHDQAQMDESTPYAANVPRVPCGETTHAHRGNVVRNATCLAPSPVAAPNANIPPQTTR